ncbi:TetR/AcrR family transcriptional regulator [Lachnoclostridium sp. An118]|uniref:TetR/AcrR family transcriptional regulator n=1 Tax=Lachnoclostridium sp. An118 TaxID=1965547 RepID=UPI000B39B13E|nr:TetR/AcrR family transcriptional regulator [Lachnoclostridium sp. An118]OUQ51344.1 TetR family transcriptional regulator [Lachnoclostridium sp. An118]
MPPKAKITKEMVIDAAFEVAHETGAENINARTVAKKLHCSTQPVMYHFSTIEELKKAAYTKADCYHSEYLMNIENPQKGIMLGIGLNYIRFAVEEPHLFRFLFQSNFFNGKTLLEMIDAEELMPVLLAMQGAIGGSIEHVKEIFLTVFLFAHGYASIIANNSLEYDEEIIRKHIENAYNGAVLAAQEETK